MYYKDKSGHFTAKENNGGECPHNKYNDMTIEKLKGITQKEYRQNTKYEQILMPTVSKSLFDMDKENFAEEVDAVINGTFDKANSHIKVLSNTPKIYIEKAGMKNLPILMSYEKLCVSMFEKSNYSDHPHGLGVELVKQFPTALNKPLYIIEGKNNKRIEAILPLKDNKGRDVFSVIEFNSAGVVNKKYIEANILVTAFGAKENYINNRIKNSNILYKK